MRLQGKTAIITGAAGAIGSAIARRFAAEGADICLAARRGAPELAAEIRALGRRAVDVKTDVTIKADNTAMVARCIAELGRVDILVTVAGVVSTGSAEALEEAE